MSRPDDPRAGGSVASSSGSSTRAACGDREVEDPSTSPSIPPQQRRHPARLLDNGSALGPGRSYTTARRARSTCRATSAGGIPARRDRRQRRRQRVPQRRQQHLPAFAVTVDAAAAGRPGDARRRRRRPGVRRLDDRGALPVTNRGVGETDRGDMDRHGLADDATAAGRRPLRRRPAGHVHHTGALAGRRQLRADGQRDAAAQASAGEYFITPWTDSLDVVLETRSTSTSTPTIRTSWTTTTTRPGRSPSWAAAGPT